MKVLGAPPREGLIRAAAGSINVRAAGAGEPARLSGHFAVFDTWTEIASSWEGNFLERIAPGAARKTIRENGNNIKLILEHGQDPQVGLKPLGRFTDLREDDEGVFYDAELYDTEYVNQLLPALRDGGFGASFRFRVIREDWNDDPGVSDYNPKGLPERTIREMSIAEGGPVLWGAYPTATAQARSLTDDFLFRALQDTTPDRLREIADRWEQVDATRAQPEGPCDECASYIADANANDAPLPPCDACDRAAERAGVPNNALEHRDAEDAGCLAQALALVAQYVEEDADEPEDIAAAQAIAEQLAALIQSEVSEPEDDSDETNSSAPEGTPRAARSTPTTPPSKGTSTRAPYHLSIRKESSWKLTSP